MTDVRVRGRTILLVEDDAHDEALIRMALDSFRLRNEIAVARDGEAALEYLFGAVGPRRRPGSRVPDLILIDAAWPHAGELEWLARLRAEEQTALVPVVVLCASGESADVLASYRAGANSYVRKPVGLQGFTEAVRALSVYWLLLNETASVRGGPDAHPLSHEDHRSIRTGAS